MNAAPRTTEGIIYCPGGVGALVKHARVTRSHGRGHVYEAVQARSRRSESRELRKPIKILLLGMWPRN
jgi:hypothetical protein